MFFWNYLVFSRMQRILAIWSLVPLPFLNPVCTSGSSWFTYCWSLAWRILRITLLACEVAQSCPTLCDPMDCSLPGSSVHVIFQARILEWFAIYFSRGSSWPRDRSQVSCTEGWFFTNYVKWAQLYGSLNILWHCPSLGLEWKHISSPVATAEYSIFAR